MENSDNCHHRSIKPNSESGFGAARSNPRRLDKLATIYIPRLADKVDASLLTPSNFFRHYQLLRNISYVDRVTDDTLFLIFPFTNTVLLEQVRQLKPQVNPEIWNKIKVVDLDALIADWMLRLISFPALTAHYALFREKYLLPF